MLDRYGAAIEFDLLRFAHVDLADWFRGLIPTRKIIRLIGMLPPESAYMSQVKANRKDHPAEGRPDPWMQYYAMTDTAEMIRALWNLLAAVNTARGKKAPSFPDPLKSAGRPMSSWIPQRAPTTSK